jgi:RNAse (barnase) inhibitor barstar
MSDFLLPSRKHHTVGVISLTRKRRDKDERTLAWIMRTHNLVLYVMREEQLKDFFNLNPLPGVYVVSSAAHPEMATIKSTAPERGYLFLTVDGRGIKDKAGILKAFAKGLSFPSYCGHNWDALDDCLFDLSWFERPQQGYVVLLDNAADFYTHASEESNVLHTILWTMVYNWWGAGKWTYVFLSEGEH